MVRLQRPLRRFQRESHGAAKSLDVFRLAGQQGLARAQLREAHSMQRLKLLWAIITADKRFGGAAIPVDMTDRPRRSKIIDRVADEDDDLVFTEVKKKLVVDVRDKDDLELYYKTIPDYFEQDDGRKLTEVPDRTSTDMIEGTY